MASPNRYKTMLNELHERIDEATSINELVPMLQHIELQTIKDMLKDRLSKANTFNDTLKIFSSSISIDKILPIDIIQHITSFNNLSEMKLVNKTFNQCYKQNQKIEIQEREKQIESKINGDKSGKTWIVHPTRTILTDKEVKLAYNGPINNIEDAITRSNDGDKILVYDGDYGKAWWRDDQKPLDNFIDNTYKLNIDKCIQIIGCGDNVHIKYCSILVRSNIYFKNIKWATFAGIFIHSQQTLFMESCDLCYVRTGIWVGSESSLTVTNCNFNDPIVDNDEAINIDEKANNVNIVGCMFTECGRNDSTPCITITSAAQTELKCIDNLFKNNYGFPIGDLDDYKLCNCNSNTTFKHNKVKHDDVLDILDNFCSVKNKNDPG